MLLCRNCQAVSSHALYEAVCKLAHYVYHTAVNLHTAAVLAKLKSVCL